MAPHIRTVTTASGARAVQIVYSKRGGKREMDHIGSAHTDAEYELLLAAARQKLVAGQQEFDLGLEAPKVSVVPITSSRMGVLWDLLTLAYSKLDFDVVASQEDGDVFRRLTLARLIEPTSKLDAARVLEEAGIAAPSYATLKRRLPMYADPAFREGIAAANADHVGLGPATICLYDVTTLYFETDQGDGFRESGFSKERRLEPQITVGLLTDASGFPLMVEAFEGNTAETKTMLPVIEAFMRAHHLTDVVVVADAGMVSEGNKKALEAAGLSYVLGEKTPQVPSIIRRWREEHPGEELPDHAIFIENGPIDPVTGRPRQVRYYRYTQSYARRTLRGIETQVEKARAQVEGRAQVKRNRFVKLEGGSKQVNEELAKKARELAGIKGYVTNLTGWSPEQVVAAYHRLYEVEKSFRMSKSDLKARPIYHHTKDSINAHLTIVFAALAVARWLENASGWSIRKLVKTMRRYRTVQIQVGSQIVTAEDPLTEELRAVVDRVRVAGGALN